MTEIVCKQPGLLKQRFKAEVLNVNPVDIGLKDLMQLQEFQDYNLYLEVNLLE